jgi:hypothetical protein
VLVITVSLSVASKPHAETLGQIEGAVGERVTLAALVGAARSAGSRPMCPAHELNIALRGGGRPAG